MSQVDNVKQPELLAGLLAMVVQQITARQQVFLLAGVFEMHHIRLLQVAQVANGHMTTPR